MTLNCATSPHTAPLPCQLCYKSFSYCSTAMSTVLQVLLILLHCHVNCATSPSHTAPLPCQLCYKSFSYCSTAMSTMLQVLLILLHCHVNCATSPSHTALRPCQLCYKSFSYCSTAMSTVLQVLILLHCHASMHVWSQLVETLVLLSTFDFLNKLNRSAKNTEHNRRAQNRIDQLLISVSRPANRYRFLKVMNRIE